MMKIKTITLPREKAKEEWRTYLAMLKKRKDTYLKEFKNAYWQLAKGRKIIDIYEVFRNTGVGKKERPRMAIAPINAKKVGFSRTRSAGLFYTRDTAPRFWVRLPEGTFPKWAKKEEWARKEFETVVPVIPAQFLPLGKYGYYLLWEAKDWKEVPRDPILLKRVSKNLFAVLTHWRLTKLERAVVAGRK